MLAERGVNARANQAVALKCSCLAGKLQAVHDYLADCFPGQTLRDVHTQRSAPSSRASASSSDYHIVRIGDVTRPYSVVMTTQFLDHPLNELRERLERMRLLDALQTHRLVIVWRDGAYPLRPSGPEHG